MTKIPNDQISLEDFENLDETLDRELSIEEVTPKAISLPQEEIDFLMGLERPMIDRKRFSKHVRHYKVTAVFENKRIDACTRESFAEAVYVYKLILGEIPKKDIFVR